MSNRWGTQLGVCLFGDLIENRMMDGGDMRTFHKNKSNIIFYWVLGKKPQKSRKNPLKQFTGILSLAISYL